MKSVESIRREVKELGRQVTPKPQLEDPVGFINGKPVSLQTLTEYLIAVSRNTEATN